MEQQTIPVANWDSYETAFPSFEEYSTEAPADPYPKGDKVQDGRYQLALTSITEPFKNPFPDPRNKNPKPICYLYWTVVGADDPADIGAVIRKKVTFSGHPMSSAYPFLELAYGGSIPPEVKPSFSKMRDMQIDVVFITRRKVGNNGPYEYQAWEAMQAVPEDKHKPVVPF